MIEKKKIIIHTLTGNNLKIAWKDELVIYLQQFNSGQVNNIFIHRGSVKNLIKELKGILS